MTNREALLEAARLLVRHARETDSDVVHVESHPDGPHRTRWLVVAVVGDVNVALVRGVMLSLEENGEEMPQA